MTSIVYPLTDFTRVEQLNIVRGEGVYVHDEGGRRYLEGLAGLWCAALGYGNRELINAIDAQLKTLSYSHCFGGRTHQVVMELAERLTKMAPVEDARVFFANSGSEANDSQIKMLRYYFNVSGRPRKKKIITLERSYHGVTMAAASLTGLPVMHAHFDLPTEALGVIRAESPHYYRGHRQGETREQFCDRLLEDLERLIVAEDPASIAAFVAEPVSGASGVIVPPEHYFPRVQKLLSKYGILLWSDEVICGFGRTGADFGCTGMGFTPQLMSLAKQLSAAYIPLSAALIPGFMYEAMVQPSTEVGIFGHGYTYSGHPVACAAALKMLDIYQRDRLCERAATIGACMQERLREFADHPLVGEVRGKGLIAAVELVANKDTGRPFSDGRVGAWARQACQDHGLLIRAVAGNSLAFCPPLIITEEQIDEMIGCLAAALRDTLDYCTREGLLENPARSTSASRQT